MKFWILIFVLMILSQLSALGLAALIIGLHKRRQLMLAKIERGNAAFEHLLNQQKPPVPPPNVSPFPKKAE